MLLVASFATRALHDRRCSSWYRFAIRLCASCSSAPASSAAPMAPSPCASNSLTRFRVMYLRVDYVIYNTLSYWQCFYNVQSLLTNKRRFFADFGLDEEESKKGRKPGIVLTFQYFLYIYVYPYCTITSILTVINLFLINRWYCSIDNTNLNVADFEATFAGNVDDHFRIGLCRNETIASALHAILLKRLHYCFTTCPSNSHHWRRF